MASLSSSPSTSSSSSLDIRGCGEGAVERSGLAAAGVVGASNSRSSHSSQEEMAGVGPGSLRAEAQAEAEAEASPSSSSSTQGQTTARRPVRRCCMGTLLYTRAMRDSARPPICVGYDVPVGTQYPNSLPNTRHADKMESAADFKYACIGASQYSRCLDGAPQKGDLPFCYTGVQYIAVRRAEQAQGDQRPGQAPPAFDPFKTHKNMYAAWKKLQQKPPPSKVDSPSPEASSEEFAMPQLFAHFSGVLWSKMEDNAAVIARALGFSPRGPGRGTNQ
eukprot:jgi/Chlat1/2237/Chrsp17S02782